MFTAIPAAKELCNPKEQEKLAERIGKKIRNAKQKGKINCKVLTCNLYGDIGQDLHQKGYEFSVKEGRYTYTMKICW